MTKVDLETQVNTLSDELDFLRQIYDAVINLFDFYPHKHLVECYVKKISETAFSLGNPRDARPDQGYICGGGDGQQP